MDNYDLQVDMAKRIFLQYDQEKMIGKFALRFDEEWLYLTYLNTPLRIHREDGRIEEFVLDVWCQCRNYTTVMTVYDLLCCNQGEKMPELSGQWCTVGTFIVAGITETEPFTEKYAQCFQGQLDKLRDACLERGGVLQKPLAGADLTCLFYATEFFSVLLQFWDADEEFPAKLLILWDRNSHHFLRFETTFYLQGDLLQSLENSMQTGAV